MKPEKTNLSLQSLPAQLSRALSRAKPYAALFFFVLIAAVYGFVLFRINTLSNAQPDPNAVDQEVHTARISHIDNAVVNQLKSLKDNSVNVKTLFDQARNNPFQE